MTTADGSSQATPAGAETPALSGTPATPHNFEIQKEEHRRIRNDPDYDDWEYGTEPLPHEAWVPGSRPESDATTGP